eukprot:gene20469-24525_t
MQRSGSTWQFNVLRTVLEQALGETVPTFHGHSDRLEEILSFQRDFSRAHVVKIHQYVPRLHQNVDFVFTSHRDLRDVALSYFKMQSSLPKGHPWDFPQFVRFFNHYLQWVPYATYDMHYEHMKRDQAAIVGEIVKRLGLTGCVDVAEVVEAVEQSRKDTKRNWDPVTAYHTTDHIHPDSTDPAAHKRLWSTLPKGAVQFITKVVSEPSYRLWLRANGYGDAALPQTAEGGVERSKASSEPEAAAWTAGTGRDAERAAATMVNQGVEALEA